MSIAGRKWAGPVLLAIAHGATRFMQIQHSIDGISGRLLSQRLKSLEAEQLITRTVVPTTPAHAEYRLTPRGQALVEALRPLAEWGMLRSAR